jgi:hypothetical protein
MLEQSASKSHLAFFSPKHNSNQNQSLLVFWETHGHNPLHKLKTIKATKLNKPPVAQSIGNPFMTHLWMSHN